MTTVLVLDDPESGRRLLATALAGEGYRLLEASTGEEAFELARAERPELIIADVLMDDHEFVGKLRAHETTRTIPVILCTATDGAEEVRRAADAWSISQILVKPFEPEDVVQVVAEELT
jgi:CheY-like chemotaxis protein